MYENHYYTLHKTCPCKIEDAVIQQTISIHKRSDRLSAFIEKIEKMRTIGKSICYAENEHVIYITKRYACECGGGCPKNKTLIGKRCHCDYYNHTSIIRPIYYCKCGAEFYRPLFAPIFGHKVLIEPYSTVLSGGNECIIAVRTDKTEGK